MYAVRSPRLAGVARASLTDPIATRARRILLLGVTYKPNIADQRESPAVPLAKRLAEKGATVQYHDPHVTEWRALGDRASRADDLDAAVAAAMDRRESLARPLQSTPA